MTRSSRQFVQILLLAGVVSTSGLLLAATPGADPAHVKQLTDTRNCPGCDLSGASFQGASFAKSNLAGSNLTETDLYKADLSQANLTGADLTDTDLRGTNLLAAKGADLSRAKTDKRTTCPDASAGPCK